MARKPDPRQYELLGWIEKAKANDRPRWRPDTAVEAFMQHIRAFHDTAVAGDRSAQDEVYWTIDRFISDVHDDSEAWEHNSRDGTASNWFTREWLLQATRVSSFPRGDEPIYLGQMFSENAVLNGEPVLVVCAGLSSQRVKVFGPGVGRQRDFWAGLGMGGFHSLEGRTPLEYIVSRCTPDRAA